MEENDGDLMKGVFAKMFWRRKAVLIACASLLLVLFILLPLNACISTITPPEEVSDPLSVYLLKEARHVGIVLPDFKGGFVEYGYGDWDWYAMLRDKWYNVFDTMLWPTQGCLGRRAIGSRNETPFHGGADLYPIVVENEDARRLLEKLTECFEANYSTFHRNFSYGVDFVKVDRSFWLFHNCHDSIADWMTELGCSVTWLPVRLGINPPAE